MSSLQLQQMPHPARPSATVQVFRDWRHACKHLEDHLLTQPECLAWAIVCPEYEEIVDPNDVQARFEYAERAKRTEGTTAQGLYDLYSKAITSNGTDATKLKWVKSEGRLTVALGTDGLLMLIEDMVTTAFLPGQGDAQATRESQQVNETRGLSRERGMRLGRPGRRGEEAERDRISRVKREAGWTRIQKLYYRVFRPAAQSIRRFHRGAYDMNGNVVRGDYALLKGALPRQSQLAYEHWIILRRQCGREV